MSEMEPQKLNLILEDLTLVRVPKTETFNVPESARPIIIHFVEEVKRNLQKNEGLSERPWIINFDRKETIKYGEIIPTINRNHFQFIHISYYCCKFSKSEQFFTINQHVGF